MTSIRRVEDLDLDRHAVLEASAGTGKTFTLERLVLRLLLEGKATLDHILLVTYTEKATGELRGRLRDTLETELQKAAGPEQATLQEALDQFDQMPILTIHAFCQRVLQDHAFDHGQDFKPQLIDDRTLLRSCLREIQRKHWREDYGDKLRTLLETAGYNRDGAEAWEARVLDLAERVRPACNHRLLPDPVDLVQELQAPGDAGRLQHQLTIRTVHQLQHLLREHKRQRGLMSFEDMLTRVDEGLDPERNPRAEALRNTLRERFHYAVVDEFQDTDPLQWRIFRRLFLEGGRGRLFVVGDPKQAIFSFRGADLHTYIAAVDHLREHGAQEFPLSVNWRSSADLLTGLNRLFADGEWLGVSPAYHPVEPATDPAKRSAVISDPAGRAALTLVTVGGELTARQARRQFCRFAVSEIRRLLAHPPTIYVKHKKRLLQPGDICLLVMRRSEAEWLVKDLGEAKIPCSLYKQTGLWQTDEALHVEALLKALARPDERPSLTRPSLTRALLTRFFRVPAADLAQCDDLPPRHPARVLFDHWVDLAEGRKWAALFQAMLEQSGMLHVDFLGAPQGERRLANYRHILGCLEQAAYAENLDLFGVLDLLHQRRGLRDGRDTDLQPIETDRDKVTVLTMHACKGLEYPVVFVAGGFTGGRESLIKYHVHGDLVYDLHPDKDARTQAKAERLAEQRRLFYVALTRAMVRLYVPWVTLASSRGSGPLSSMVAPALEKAQIVQLGHPVVERIDCPKSRTAITSITSTAAPAPSAVPLVNDAAIVFPRLDANLHQRRIVLRSFSSIHRKLLLRAAEEASFGEEPPRADDDVPEAVEDYDPLRGPVFGDMVHKVLEKVDFEAAGRAPAPEGLLGESGPLDRLLEEQLGRNLLRLRSRTPAAALAQLCREQIARMVWVALHTPLDALGGPLWQVAAGDRLHELEFHFPEIWDEPLPAEVRREEGFLTGIMDLVVRRQERFYLVDWKTNLLSAYTPDAVAEAMADCDYIRQYRLYLHALARWLSRVRGREIDRARDFGGVYYLFLRGLNGRDESTGVYFRRPTADDLQLERVLATS